MTDGEERVGPGPDRRDADAATPRRRDAEAPEDDSLRNVLSAEIRQRSARDALAHLTNLLELSLESAGLIRHFLGSGAVVGTLKGRLALAADSGLSEVVVVEEASRELLGCLDAVQRLFRKGNAVGDLE